MTSLAKRPAEQPTARPPAPAPHQLNYHTPGSDTQYVPRAREYLRDIAIVLLVILAPVWVPRLIELAQDLERSVQP